MYIKRRIKTKPDKLTRQLFLFMLIVSDREFSVEHVLSDFGISLQTLKRDLRMLESIGLIKCYTVDEFSFDLDHDLGGEVNPGATPSPDDEKLKRFGRILDLYFEISGSLWLYFRKHFPGDYPELDYLLEKYDNMMDDDYDDDDDIPDPPEDFSNIRACYFFRPKMSPAKKREIQRDFKVLSTAIELLFHYHDPEYPVPK